MWNFKKKYLVYKGEENNISNMHSTFQGRTSKMIFKKLFQIFSKVAITPPTGPSTAYPSTGQGRACFSFYINIIAEDVR